MKIPEHEKLKLVSKESQVCGEFIDWLNGEGFRVVPVNRRSRAFNIRRELAAFFGIDEDKLEEEKRAMLEALQKGEQI